MLDLFLRNMQLLASQDINWWTGVVWITCGLLWCFYQLFGLSFWRHPFTAEDPLLSKWCNATFLQIWWRNKLIYILDELRVSTVSFLVNYSFKNITYDKMALLCSAAIRAAPLRLCFYLLFYLLLISIFTHITSALITYDKSALLDIGNRFTNLVQDTLSPNPSWPLEILRNAENKGHRRRNKKHRGKSAGIRNRLRKSAHSPPLPSLLLANVQSLDNKMDDLRARISFQRDIRDCNIICLTETWLTPSVPDTAVTPSDNFSVLRMDRTAEAVNPRVVVCASWLTRNGVTPGISPLCRDPARLIWNIYPLFAAHSIYPASSPRSSLLPFTSHHRQTRAWLCLNFTMWSAATLTNILTLLLSSRGILTSQPQAGHAELSPACILSNQRTEYTGSLLLSV